MKTNRKKIKKGIENRIKTLKKRSLKNGLLFFSVFIFSLFVVSYYLYNNYNLSNTINKEIKIYSDELYSSKVNAINSMLNIIGINFSKNELETYEKIKSNELDMIIVDEDGICFLDTINSQNINNDIFNLQDDNSKEIIKELIENGQNESHYIITTLNGIEYIFKSKKIEDKIVIVTSKTKSIQEKVAIYKQNILKGFYLQLAIFSIFTLIILCITIFFMNIILKKQLINPIINLITKTMDISNGDLTIKFDYKNNDEIGDLSKAFESMVETLKNLNQKIYIAVTVLTKNLKILYNSSNVVKDSANTQAATVEETESNFESLNKMIETITNEANKANHYATEALSKARIGIDSMSKLQKEMNKIETSSLEITDIITLINDIAEQTNLLSLNASIESARAGEAGKGFNIVASEIRKLAEKSTNAADRIHKLITNNNLVIQEGVKYSKQTTEILSEITTSNELISNLVKIVTGEITKIKNSSEEILKSINHISDIAQDNLNESENMSKIMIDFVDQTLELQKFVGQFDVRTDEQKGKHKHIEELLKAKLIESDTIIKDIGGYLLPTGNKVLIKNFKLDELQIGKTPLTGNSYIVDTISQRTNTSVTFFQPYENQLVRVATTVRNFDNTRAIGTTIPETSPVYQTVMEGKTYYGRAFVVNRWFVAVYKPIKDETGYVNGVLYLGLPESITNDDTKNEIGISEKVEEIMEAEPVD